MWYLSSTKWAIIDDHPEPYYHVKYAESVDGINWDRKGVISLDFNEEIDAIGNPTVLLRDGIYKMFFSYRKAGGYRNDPNKAYKIGCAETLDGIKFTIESKSIDNYDERGNWESIMNAYPHVFTHNDQTFMLYNGNGFGKSGFGYSILEEG